MKKNQNMEKHIVKKVLQKPLPTSDSDFNFKNSTNKCKRKIEMKVDIF